MAKCVVRRTPLWRRLWFYKAWQMRYEKFGINGQLRNKHFFIVIHCFSRVKTAVNALRICKMRNGVSKTPSISSFFNCPSAQWIFSAAIKNSVNCCTIVNWKTRKRSNTLKGSQRMGGGRIFLKTYCSSLINEDLSNDPNFGRIHLAGQYL